MELIDTHQHFWRYEPRGYGWMPPDADLLRQDRLPQEIRPQMQACGVTAAVAVQARAVEEETDFLLELSRHHGWIVGVVGWVDLRADDLARRLDRWQGDLALVGFRHQVQDESDVAAFLADPIFNAGLRLLQQRELTYEVLVHQNQLEPALAFCARHDRHWLVLDHMGKPDLRGGDLAGWQRSLRNAAAMPHLLCKLSGLISQAGPEFDEAQLRRCLDIALEIFGPRRLMFGSDWPVCLQETSYARVTGIVTEWATALSSAERQAVAAGTAQRGYRLSRRFVSVDWAT